MGSILQLEPAVKQLRFIQRTGPSSEHSLLSSSPAAVTSPPAAAAPPTFTEQRSSTTIASLESPADATENVQLLFGINNRSNCCNGSTDKKKQPVHNNNSNMEMSKASRKRGKVAFPQQALLLFFRRIMGKADTKEQLDICKDSSFGSSCMQDVADEKDTKESLKSQTAVAAANATATEAGALTRERDKHKREEFRARAVRLWDGLHGSSTNAPASIVSPRSETQEKLLAFSSRERRSSDMSCVVQEQHQRKHRLALTERDIHEDFDGERNKASGNAWACARRRAAKEWETFSCFRLLQSLFPLVSVVRNYKLQYLSADFFSGISEGVMAVPMGMSYAMLAKLPPQYGLYVGLFYPLIYMFLGSSSQVNVGVSAIEDLLAGEAVSRLIYEKEWLLRLESRRTAALQQLQQQQASSVYDAAEADVAEQTLQGVAEEQQLLEQTRIKIAIGLCVCVGLVYCVMKVVQAHMIADLLSVPVLSGFSTASAFLIGTSQLKHLLGINVPSFIENADFKLPKQWWHFLTHLGSANWGSAGICMFCLLILTICKKVNKRYFKRFPLPGPLIIVVIFTALTAVLRLDIHLNLKVVGSIPRGFPSPQLPTFMIPSVALSEGKKESSETLILLNMLREALLLTAMFFIIHISIAKTLAHQNRENNQQLRPEQELLALACCNFFGAFMQCFPCATSLSRSSVAASTGARTQLHSVSNVLLMTFTLSLITPLLFYLPNAVLAAVVLFGVYGMVDFSEFFKLCKIGGLDVWLWITCFLVTIIFGAVEGIVASIGLSLLWLLRKTARPHCITLGRLPQTQIYRNVERFPMAIEEPGVKILRFDASLNFCNSDYFENRVRQLVAALPSKTSFDLSKRQQFCVSLSPSLAPTSDSQFHYMKPHWLNAFKTRASLNRKPLRQVRRSLAPAQSVHATSVIASLPQNRSAPPSPTAPVSGPSRSESSTPPPPLLGPSVAPQKPPHSPLPSPLSPSCRVHSDSVPLFSRDHHLSGAVSFAAGGGGVAAVSSPSSTHSKKKRFSAEKSAISGSTGSSFSTTIKILIIDCSSVNDLDVTAIRMLQRVTLFLKENDIFLFFANWKGPMRDFLQKADFYKVLPPQCCFLSISDAVFHAKRLIRHLEGKEEVVGSSPLEPLFEWQHLKKRRSPNFEGQRPICTKQPWKPQHTVLEEEKSKHSTGKFFEQQQLQQKNSSSSYCYYNDYYYYCYCKQQEEEEGGPKNCSVNDDGGGGNDGAMNVQEKQNCVLQRSTMEQKQQQQQSSSPSQKGLNHYYCCCCTKQTPESANIPQQLQRLGTHNYHHYHQQNNQQLPEEVRMEEEKACESSCRQQHATKTTHEPVKQKKYQLQQQRGDTISCQTNSPKTPVQENVKDEGEEKGEGGEEGEKRGGADTAVIKGEEGDGEGEGEGGAADTAVIEGEAEGEGGGKGAAAAAVKLVIGRTEGEGHVSRRRDFLYGSGSSSSRSRKKRSTSNSRLSCCEGAPRALVAFAETSSPASKREVLLGALALARQPRKRSRSRERAAEETAAAATVGTTASAAAAAVAGTTVGETAERCAVAAAAVNTAVRNSQTDTGLSGETWKVLEKRKSFLETRRSKSLSEISVTERVLSRHISSRNFIPLLGRSQQQQRRQLKCSSSKGRASSDSSRGFSETTIRAEPFTISPTDMCPGAAVPSAGLGVWPITTTEAQNHQLLRSPLYHSNATTLKRSAGLRRKSFSACSSTEQEDSHTTYTERHLRSSYKTRESPALEYVTEITGAGERVDWAILRTEDCSPLARKA